MGQSDPLTIYLCASMIMIIQLTSKPLVKIRNLRLYVMTEIYDGYDILRALTFHHESMSIWVSTEVLGPQ